MNVQNPLKFLKFGEMSIRKRINIPPSNLSNTYRNLPGSESSTSSPGWETLERDHGWFKKPLSKKVFPKHDTNVRQHKEILIM